MIKVYTNSTPAINTALQNLFKSNGFVCVEKSNADIIISNKMLNETIPVIVLGIDVSLPIKAKTLLRHIQAVLNQSQRSKPITHDKLTLYNADLKVKVDETIHTITEKEADILTALINNDYLSKEALLKQVWGYDNNIDTHTLQTHIYRLRKKLGKGIITTNIDGNYTLTK